MRPLIVRLPNWIGDVIMSLPALWHLQAHGYQLKLIGRGWAGPLLAPCGWTVHKLPGTLRERVTLLRQLGHDAREHDPTFDKRLNTLLLTNSFSSALDARLAGLQAVGYRQDARGWLLRHPHPRPRQPLHESRRFLELAGVLAPDIPASPPATLPFLPVAPQARQQAHERLRAHGLLDDDGRPRPYLCLVPFATGTLKGASKAWSGFVPLAPTLARQMPVLIAPDPGAETQRARNDFPDAIILEDLPLDAYAALLADSRLVIANDTGPGHLAAAVGAPLLSVLGPTDASRHAALGPRVEIIQQDPWPDVAQVEAIAQPLLQAALAGERPGRAG